MYRRPKFLEVLLEIRQRMSRQADYDVDLFAEMTRADRFIKQEGDGNRLDFNETDGEQSGGAAANESDAKR